MVTHERDNIFVTNFIILLSHNVDVNRAWEDIRESKEI
jgi:hypothetical protein